MSDILTPGPGGGGGGYNDDLNVVEDESEDEGREDEIKELLAGALDHESFDTDSDTSFLTNNGSYGHNGMARKSAGGIGIGDTNGNGNGNREISMSSNSSKSSVHTNLPTKSALQLDTNGNPGTGFPFLNTFQNQLKRNLQPPTQFGLNPTGNLPLPINGNLLNQNDKGIEEMEVQNSSISLLHNQHCPIKNRGSEGQGHGKASGDKHDLSLTPRAENNAYDQMFDGTSSSMDQLKTLCEFRERQLVRADETIETLSKDKRALNHQIGLMKAEMIEMRGIQDDYEKDLQLKDEQIQFQKSQNEEILHEFGKLKDLYTQARDENGRLGLELNKLHQQIQLRDSVGTTTQLAQVNDAVRQVHEKHAKEINAWNQKVQDLENQLRIVSKSQTQRQTFTEPEPENMVEKVSSMSQTINPKLFSTSAQTDEEICQIMSLEEQEEAKTWKDDKNHLINMYEREIEKWKEEVEALPAQLFGVWEKNLASRKPQTIDSGTSPIEKAPTVTSNVSINCNLIPKQPSPPLLIDTQTQTAGATGSGSRDLHNSSFSRSIEDLHKMRQFLDDPCQIRMSLPNGNASVSSPPMSSFVVNNPIHPTHCTVQVQTDQTLETYRILTELMEQLINEVGECTHRATLAEEKFEITHGDLELAMEKLVMLKEKNKSLKLTARKARAIAEAIRKQQREQLAVIEQQRAATKADGINRYIDFLSSINSTLDNITFG